MVAPSKPCKQNNGILVFRPWSESLEKEQGIFLFLFFFFFKGGGGGGGYENCRISL